ncbi:bifunctional acetate--CoA ligase family protein/GNAT family N-acetyltransferase [Planosporangium mesophilum]|uniref:GNAT family N-acetyltransferase n=1 Tax=Planosporangium mesophilum TaxID=689768 RepID=A0A8J3T8K3_9ACTN|nr:bifunctional GNAT family N-acetyltransferase/acetate--CoA ligase family protein [Planosporangium mesophilum]NJC81822.1 GNAT family N-acetyltransferase [Planosporangium mesophilum]GII20516.1 GNAT family N-acetyltransferase [Planosporangium mesophilum]
MPDRSTRSADIILSDGSTARVRQMRPDDGPAVVALHSRFSERTRYLRYFSPYPRISPRELEYFVNVDHHDREAFVVELGDRLIAIGRYDRLGAGAADAEVAFVVEDAHQGRGLGSVLLEYLAAAAREEGISRFVAEVLPINNTMLRVFSDAGYSVAREYADGVVHLTFPIAPTPESLAVQWQRERRAEAASIARLLSPRAVAVYGASSRGAGVGAALLRHLRSGGYAGHIVPVHPTASTVDGLRAYPSLTGAPGGIDLAVVAVPAEGVPDVVADCAAAGVHGLVVVSAGFAEAGPDGAEAQAQLLRTVRGQGMRLVGPNCLGIANTGVRLNATLAPRLPRAGRVGFFSQSAALGTALMAEADRRGLGLSSFVSAGNRADVSGNDLLQYWRDDTGTDVVLLYLETFGNPRKFARIARELARHKPVVAVASAVRPPALEAVAPGPDARGVSALFAHSGVIRVDTVAELFDVGLLLADQPLPAGRRIGLVTNAAALGALAEATAPAFALEFAPGYPHDVGPMADTATIRSAVSGALADPRVDALVVAYAPALAEEGDATGALAEAIQAEAAGSDKPVLAVSPYDPAWASQECGPGAVPNYPAVEEAVRALGRAAAYAAWRREPTGTAPELPDVDPGPARLIVAELAASAVSPLGDLGEADELLGCYGIEVVPSRACAGPAEAVAAVAAEVGFPVAMKVARSPWRHRIDLGAVRLDLADADDVVRAYDELQRLFGTGVEVTVQHMVAPGVACVVEAAEDPAFGPVVGFGIGGVASDLIGDRAWRPVPLTDRDAATLVRAPRAAPLLTGYRGAASVDLDALADLVLRVGRMADEHPQLHRLELNPVLARPDGLSVLHVNLQIGTPAARPDTGPRRR